MANLKTYLQSLVELAIRNTLPASSGSVIHNVSAETWTDFVSPFDGIAVVNFDGKPGCESINFYCEACHMLTPTYNGWGASWILIKKGQMIHVYLNGNQSAQLTLVPNIQSSL